MRLLIVLAILANALVVGGCSGDKPDDGSKNPPAKRLTEAEFEAQRAKKGESK